MHPLKLISIQNIKTKEHRTKEHAKEQTMSIWRTFGSEWAVYVLSRELTLTNSRSRQKTEYSFQVVSLKDITPRVDLIILVNCLL